MQPLQRYSPFVISVLVFAADRVTKWVIRDRVSAWDEIVVIPHFFSIVHTENQGAAFGIFAESAFEWRTFALIVLALAVMLFITVLLLHPSRGGLHPTRLLRTGLALILGGAAGNVFDRVIRGAVTDFLEFYFRSYHFPTFNIADTAITIGAGLLLLDVWTTRHRHKERHVSKAH